MRIHSLVKKLWLNWWQMNELEAFSPTLISRTNGSYVEWILNSLCNWCKLILDLWKFLRFPLESIWWTFLNKLNRPKNRKKKEESRKSLKENENKSRKNLNESEKKKKNDSMQCQKRKSSNLREQKKQRIGKTKVT